MQAASSETLVEIAIWVCLDYLVYNHCMERWDKIGCLCTLGYQSID